ncbi:MAG: hypothetical protein ACTHK2_04600 [Dokdonella sp.]|uniref:hypothetical protein n=1 Tax=Dokdonella sp. TaxID=2291710 RepID=UPI003F811548
MTFRYDLMFGIPVQRPQSVASMEAGLSDTVGIDIVESPYAMETVVHFDVVRVGPWHRRRKRWQVRRREERRPTAWMLGGRLVAHPSIVAELRRRCA